MTPQRKIHTATPKAPQPGTRKPQSWRFTDWAAF